MTIERPMSPPVDPTRRHLLTIAAGGAVAAVIPTAALAAAPAVDPIYAAIERHKQAAAVWDALLEQSDEDDDAVDDAWGLCEQAGIDLVTTEPTTQAGIVAAIAYIRIQMLDDGTYMPHRWEFEFNPTCAGDGKETMGWIDAFLDTVANATKALAGVQS